MKCARGKRVGGIRKSLPVRGAWIEMPRFLYFVRRIQSLSVRGAWIEIACVAPLAYIIASRSPCGERGLKCAIAVVGGQGGRSLPVRGAWVEMWISTAIVTVMDCRSPCGERGLKWQQQRQRGRGGVVAPRAGSVD